MANLIILLRKIGLNKYLKKICKIFSHQNKENDDWKILNVLKTTRFVKIEIEQNHHNI